MTQLSRRIMRRIYLVYVLRRLTARRAVALYLMVGSLVSMFAIVSVSSVVANMPPLFEVGALGEFVLAALLNTEWAVQLLALATLAALTIFASDLIKASRLESSYARTA